MRYNELKCLVDVVSPYMVSDHSTHMSVSVFGSYRDRELFLAPCSEGSCQMRQLKQLN